MDDTKVEDLIQEAMDFITNLGDDTRNLSQQESVDFYRGVADDCTERANLIRSEMG